MIIPRFEETINCFSFVSAEVRKANANLEERE